MFSTRRRIPWGAAATMLGEGLSRISLIVFQFLVANGLGAARYGTLGLVMSYAAVLLPLADAGLLNLALRRLANSRDSKAFPLLLGIKLAATAAYLVAVAGVAVFSPSSSGHVVAMAVAGVYWALTSLTDFIRQCLRASERSVDEFRARLVQPLLFIPAILVFHLLDPGVTGTLLLWCLPTAALLLAYVPPLRRAFSVFKPRLRGARTLIKGQGSFLAQGAAYLFLVTLSGRLDLWLIDAKLDRSSVGVYFAAYNMVFSGLFFAQALSSHMYPRLHRPDGPPGDGRRALARAFAAHAGLALAVLLAVLLLGGRVFDLVFHSGGFAAGHALLPVMGLLMMVSILNYLWLAVLIGINHQWLASAVLLFIVPVKIGLGLAWIPSQGALGMVRAALCAEIPASLALGSLATWLYLKRRP